MNYKRHTKRRVRYEKQRALWRWREYIKDMLTRYEEKRDYPEPESLGYKP